MSVSAALSPVEPSLAIFGLGQGEIIIILVVLLFLFGAKKLPELARGMGKSIREFKKATSEVEEDLRKAIDEDPSQQKTIRAQTPPQATPISTTPAASTPAADPAPKG